MKRIIIYTGTWILLIFTILIFISCNEDNSNGNSQILIDSKIEILFDLIKDNEQRLDKVGLASHAKVLNRLYIVENEILSDLDKIDRLFKNDHLAKSKFSVQELRSHFDQIDSFRFSEVEKIVMNSYREDGIQNHILVNMKDELNKKHNRILSKYMLEGDLNILLCKSYRIDINYFFLNSILDITRGKRTGSNYSIFPVIEYGDVSIINNKVSELLIAVGVRPIPFDFESDQIKVVLDKDTVLFNNSFDKVNYKLSKPKLVGDTIQLLLIIENPLTGEAFKVSNKYIIQ